ncbi:DUF6492 family protein [Polynucleobacter sp. UK-Gri1-W3]|uniref:DUF6492 family protein n=1 Tax=Polynucleobacter sp. UK-Gri1-W3 TaxID=1819737 RepID=UPI001C0C2401|nr:hypothetical protein [Polynucleobacter sp. UK-Gri1-W3]
MNSTSVIIDQVICVCCKRDAQAWEIASSYIVRNLKARHYKVYVPDADLELFQEISAKPFQVIGESIYTSQFAAEIKRRLDAKIASQFGWYLQQFIKLSAVNDCLPDEIVLIWDADTIPLKPLSFIDHQGRLIYYKGAEYHHPYFETVMRLLHLSKKIRFSFIAQCFVLKAAWLQECFREIELRHGMPWVPALLNSIRFDEGNSFSEYETIGTFISHRHSSEIVYTDRKWLRLGNSAIGHPAFLGPNIIADQLNDYDYASFEKWDKAKPYFLKVSLPYFFRVYLPSLFKSKNQR